jgi:SAM-dependent methyltransferase
VPFVTTPYRVVDEMLRLAAVGPNDVVYDLGSGDGRLVIAAARHFGARGVGIEIEPKPVADSIDTARRAGLGERARFVQQDLFDTDLRPATVVTLYCGIGLLGRPASEYGRLCHGAGGHEGGGRCRRAFMLTISARSRTVPVALALFPGVFEVPWGDIAAASILASPPPI